MGHALIRTSPKGGPFIGKCSKCGATGLRIRQANDHCVNPAGLTNMESLDLVMRVLEDPSHDQ